MVKLNVVERQFEPQTESLLGVIDAISTGFDRVVHRPWLLVLPLLLDAWLWFGPRLAAAPLGDELRRNLVSLGAGLDTTSQVALQEMGAMLRDSLSRFNLMSWLSVSGVGVPAVNTSLDATTPLPTGTLPPIGQVADLDTYVLVMIGLTVIGLLLAGLFWSLLAASVRGEPFSLTRWLRGGWYVGARLVGVGVLAVLSMLLLIVPTSLLIVILGSLSLGLASLAPALLVTVVVWGLLFAAFTVHGLALYGLPVARALRLSAWLLRAFFGATTGFVALALGIYLGLGLIWDMLAADSWLRLIALVGNAFIGTGLLTASLLYYQNRSAALFARLHWPLPGA